MPSGVPTRLYDDYDIHPNGRTPALVRPVGDSQGREIAWVINWPGALQSVTRD
jgi:hypothetical protein